MAASGESLSKDLTVEEFARFRDWIQKHSGIYLEDNKADSLRISLITRATRLAMPSLDAYFELLSTDEVEFKELMNLVTINETSFFRFPAQFDAFRTKVIPEVLEGKSKVSRAFRVWSAGCSTGEEPYTIAMSMFDSGLEGLGYRLEVLGTDVSTNALQRARDGVYPPRSLANLERSVVQRYFEAAPDGHRVAKRVRDICDFSFHNLIKEPYPLALMGNWDVIFCRNVTIYFRLDSTRRVVNNFFDSLNPGGFLFIGHSETLTSISDRFEPVEIDGVFLYRKPRLRRHVSFSAVKAARSSETSASAGRLSSEGATTHPGRRAATPAPPQSADDQGEGGGEDLVAQARALLAEGDPRAALTVVSRLLAADVNDVEAYLLAAYAHADTGDFEKAIEECYKALAINPLVAAARYILGIIYQ
ncbi:MAG: CheR family methyltransferase, partial [Actinomycetota bacterium]|nr:CheR family methyltransferase [Actinomycetota bacterium]